MTLWRKLQIERVTTVMTVVLYVLFKRIKKNGGGVKSTNILNKYTPGKEGVVWGGGGGVRCAYSSDVLFSTSNKEHTLK